MSFESDERWKLERSVLRLARMLELGIPLEIVSGEVKILIMRAVGLCGPRILTGIGEELLKQERMGAGVCVGCKGGSPKPAGPPYWICENCSKEMDKALDETQMDKPES